MSRALLVVLLVLLAPSAAGAAPGSAPRVPADWIGVAADGPLTAPGAPLDGEWDRLARSGAGFVRAAFYWRELQPAPGTMDFTTTDAVVLEAAQRGLRVLPVVISAPDWAALEPGNLASPPRGQAAYARMLGQLAARYGAGGSLWSSHPALAALPIRDWQVWNEPNLTAYWSRQPFARAYVKLLRASRTALRRVDPGVRVLLAGLPNQSWLALRAIYAAGGRGSFDAVALHPYTSRVQHIVELVRLARREMRRAHDGARPVWMTEISWPASAEHSGVVPGGFEVTDRGQARRLRQTFIALARVRRSLRIAKLVWYTWISAEGKALPTWSGYSGLRRVRADGTTVTAPALAAFKRTVAQLRR